MMKINLTWLGLLAFVALLFTAHDLHETAHMVVGRLLCGEWGIRDFNNVSPMVDACEIGSLQLMIAYAGPLMSYLGMWIGFLLLNKEYDFTRQIWGFCLLFANVPFARFFTAMVHGGDEFGALKYLMADSIGFHGVWILNILLVSVLIIPPLIRAFYFLQIPKRIGIFISFLILPMLLEFVLLHKGLNSVLKQDVLYEPINLGNPFLVNILIFIELIILFALYAKIKTLFVKV